METFVAALCVAILVVAAAFHLYWGCGGKRGIGVAVPQHQDGKPIFLVGAAGAITVGALLLGVAALVTALAIAPPLSMPRHWLRIGLGLSSSIFLARALSWSRFVGLFKSIRTTEFARYDTWLYSPLCLVLGLGLAYLALLSDPT